MKHFLSLGAGVQSSTLALMAAAGKIEPMPLGAVFADTGWEPRAVYDWLDWLEPQLPFPVYRVRADGPRYQGKTLRSFTLEATLRDTRKPLPLPVYSVERGAPHTRRGMMRRQCTRDWKIRPIERKVKELAGFRKGARLPTEPVVIQWIGISLDEVQRAKPSREKWKRHRHPLAFEAQMRRQDCLDWLSAHGYPEPPRSACIGCPFHDDYEWWQIRQNPAEWRDAVEVDEAIRDTGGMRGQVFLHQSGRPLAEAVPTREPERKVANPVNMQLFNECEGICGV